MIVTKNLCLQTTRLNKYVLVRDVGFGAGDCDIQGRG